MPGTSLSDLRDIYKSCDSMESMYLLLPEKNEDNQWENSGTWYIKITFILKKTWQGCCLCFLCLLCYNSDDIAPGKYVQGNNRRLSSPYPDQQRQRWTRQSHWQRTWIVRGFKIDRQIDHRKSSPLCRNLKEIASSGIPLWEFMIPENTTENIQKFARNVLAIYLAGRPWNCLPWIVLDLSYIKSCDHQIHVFFYEKIHVEIRYTRKMAGIRCFLCLFKSWWHYQTGQWDQSPYFHFHHWFFPASGKGIYWYPGCWKIFKKYGTFWPIRHLHSVITLIRRSGCTFDHLFSLPSRSTYPILPAVYIYPGMRRNPVTAVFPGYWPCLVPIWNICLAKRSFYIGFPDQFGLMLLIGVYILPLFGTESSIWGSLALILLGLSAALAAIGYGIAIEILPTRPINRLYSGQYPLS